MTHVEDDDCVGRLKVNSETTGTSGEEEDKVGRARCVEVFDRLLTRVRTNRACSMA